jgi:hypothetical protein
MNDGDSESPNHRITESLGSLLNPKSQHRPIYDLMEEVRKLASLPIEELASDQDRLRQLFEEHALAESRLPQGSIDLQGTNRH